MALHLNELKIPKVVFGSSFLSNYVFERGSEKRRTRVEEYPDFGGRSTPFLVSKLSKRKKGAKA